MKNMNRRDFIKINAMSALGVAALGLKACSPGNGDSGGAAPAGTEGDDGAGEAPAGATRFAWWGGSDRQEMYNNALDVFQEENPDFDLAREFADFNPYQDRIATQMAGGNVPDIFWIAATSVLTFYENGMYHSLEGLDNLDLSDFDQATIDEWKLDGELLTIPIAAYTGVVRANQTFLEEEGVDLPDDEEWTWESLKEFMLDYQAQAPEGRFASGYHANSDIVFESWCRAHGQELWSEDGNVGWDAEVVGEWFAWWEELRNAGAATSLAQQLETTPDWAEIGDKVLLTFQSSNHLTDNALLFPDYRITQHFCPKASASDDLSHLFIYTPRSAVYSGSEDPEAAATLLSFMLNNEAMGLHVGTTMGPPPNPRVREVAYEHETEAGREVIDFTDRVEEVSNRRPRYEAPNGASTWRTIFDRAVEEVALEQSSVSEAAERMTNDIQAEIDDVRE